MWTAISLGTNVWPQRQATNINLQPFVIKINKPTDIIELFILRGLVGPTLRKWVRFVLIPYFDSFIADVVQEPANLKSIVE